MICSDYIIVLVKKQNSINKVISTREKKCLNTFNEFLKVLLWGLK